jgi:hypothetical protein
LQLNEKLNSQNILNLFSTCFVVNSLKNNTFAKLKWNKFSDRLNFNTCKYIYKALNQLSSDYSKQFFNYITRVNTRLGEDQLKLVIPNAKCNFLINTIFYKGVKGWNNLPFEIRNIQTLDGFINCFKSYFKLFKKKSFIQIHIFILYNGPQGRTAVKLIELTIIKFKFKNNILSVTSEILFSSLLFSNKQKFIKYF